MTDRKTIKRRGEYHAVRLVADRNHCELYQGDFLMAKGGYEYIARLFDQFVSQSGE